MDDASIPEASLRLLHALCISTNAWYIRLLSLNSMSNLVSTGPLTLLGVIVIIEKLKITDDV